MPVVRESSHETAMTGTGVEQQRPIVEVIVNVRREARRYPCCPQRAARPPARRLLLRCSQPLGHLASAGRFELGAGAVVGRRARYPRGAGGSKRIHAAARRRSPRGGATPHPPHVVKPTAPSSYGERFVKG